MANSGKLNVFYSLKRKEIAHWGREIDALSPLKNLPGSDDDAGLVALKNGGLRKVIQINGFNSAFGELEHEHIQQVFQALLTCLDQHNSLQMLAINKPIHREKFMDENIHLGSQGHAYLEWYADYTQKWFRRICEISIVPKRSFYIIVAADKQESEQKTHANLDQCLLRVLHILDRAELKPQVLKRNELRRLLYSCMRPSYRSGLKEAPAELLNATSLQRVNLTAKGDFVELDGMRVSTQVISDLPAQSIVGWLMELVSMQFQSTISVHVRRVFPESLQTRLKKQTSQLNEKAMELLSKANTMPAEITCYISCEEDATEDLPVIESQIGEIRRVLEKHNALVTTKCDQVSAWTSSLPLGIDSGGIAHCLAGEDAANFWPLFTNSCGSTAGFPIGFGRNSHEPILLDPQAESTTIALASNNRDLNFLNALVCLRLLSANRRILFIHDESHTPTQLKNVLGPGSVAVITREGRDIEGLLDEDRHKVLSVLQIERIAAAPTEFTELIRQWKDLVPSSEKLPAIIIASAEKLVTTFGPACLDEIVSTAKEEGTYILIGANTASCQPDCDIEKFLNQDFDAQFILPQTDEANSLGSLTRVIEPRELAAVESVKQSAPDSTEMDCYLRTKTNRDIIRLVPSPMDFWICHPLDKPRRKEMSKMMERVNQNNPQLNETDKVRQAIYYLGLEF